MKKASEFELYDSYFRTYTSVMMEAIENGWSDEDFNVIMGEVRVLWLDRYPDKSS